MPGMSGLDLLGELKHLAPQVPVIIITAFGTIRTAVEAMRGGAFEYSRKTRQQRRAEAGRRQGARA